MIHARRSTIHTSPKSQQLQGTLNTQGSFRILRIIEEAEMNGNHSIRSLRGFFNMLLVLLLALCIGIAPTALADGTDGWQYDESGQKTHWIQDGRPVTSTLITDPADGEKYWLEADGTLARSKQIYDPASDAWYWVDADGTVAVDKDVYIPEQGKWVRYDSQGRMVKGEDCRYGGWYYFDPITGAMAKGMRYIPSNGGKWVYYDWTTGQMAHGERYVDYDREHTGWYLFDPVTGAMQKGMRHLDSNGGKWVYYDWITGIMAHGERYLNYDGEHTGWYYFDPVTGATSYGFVRLPDGRTVFYDRITGKMVYGWQNIDGKRYYFNTTTGALERQEEIVQPTTVWWVSSGEVYHTHRDCPSLSRSTHVYSGSLEQANHAGHTRLCRNCEQMG